MATQTVALPGQILGPSTKYTPGSGTHIHNSQICASLAGTIAQSSSSSSNLPTLSIHQQSTHTTSSILPSVNSIVLARVTRTNPRQATLLILVVDGHVCASDGFQGVVRVQDVRATEKDKVVIGSSFRPGDLVRAVVISLGDQANYYLSTAMNELGVVSARSEGGNEMRPVSWREFRDPVTGIVEARKVAKPG